MRHHAFGSSRVPARLAYDVALIDTDSLTAAIAAVCASVFVVVVAYAPATSLMFLRGELGFVENASALAYVAGVGFAIAAARLAHGLERANWIMWAVLCVLFFGEETSWLQQWIGYATPEKVSAVNVQHEFNLHNLKIVSPDDRIFIAGSVAFSWRHFLSAQVLFDLGFTFYFLVLPVLALAAPVRSLMHRIGVPPIGLRLVAAVWAPIAVSIVLTVVNRSYESEKSLIAETREMFFAFAIMWFIVAGYYALRRARLRPRPSGVSTASGRDEDDEEIAAL
jgi:hypothetical protein